MKDIGRIRGSASQAVPVVIGKDLVYVHTDIVKIEEVDEMGNPRIDYEYNEIQYTHPEFIQLQLEKQQALEEELSNAQLALLELYENMG